MDRYVAASSIPAALAGIAVWSLMDVKPEQIPACKVAVSGLMVGTALLCGLILGLRDAVGQSDTTDSPVTEESPLGDGKSAAPPPASEPSDFWALAVYPAKYGAAAAAAWLLLSLVFESGAGYTPNSIRVTCGNTEPISLVSTAKLVILLTVGAFVVWFLVAVTAWANKLIRDGLRHLSTLGPGGIKRWEDIVTAGQALVSAIVGAALAAWKMGLFH